MNISSEREYKTDSIEDKFRLKLFTEFEGFVLIVFSHEHAFSFALSFASIINLCFRLYMKPGI